MSEKTEKPSPKRLREAREKGQIARSLPLAAATALLFGLGALLATAPSLFADLQAYARESLSRAGAVPFSPSIAFARALQMLAVGTLPAVGAAFAGALLGAGLQAGFIVNKSAIIPNFERISPAKGLERIFSRKSLLDFCKSLLFGSIVLWLAWNAAKEAAPLAGRLSLANPMQSFSAALEATKGFLFKALGAAVAIGVVDYLFERHAHLRGLMMSRDELKREHKESEGDPHHKAKRKALHRSLLNGTLARGVQKASVVIVNPTHVAVALRYDPQESGAPTIVAKGVEDEAAKIRWLARRLKVPMVRDVPLARALVRYDLGEEIPEELYQAAAAVLAKVYEMGAAQPVTQRNTP